MEEQQPQQQQDSANAGKTKNKNRRRKPKPQPEKEQKQQQNKGSTNKKKPTRKKRNNNNNSSNNNTNKRRSRRSSRVGGLVGVVERTRVVVRHANVEGPVPENIVHVIPEKTDGRRDRCYVLQFENEIKAKKYCQGLDEKDGICELALNRRRVGVVKTATDQGEANQESENLSGLANDPEFQAFCTFLENKDKFTAAASTTKESTPKEDVDSSSTTNTPTAAPNAPQSNLLKFLLKQSSNFAKKKSKSTKSTSANAQNKNKNKSKSKNKNKKTNNNNKQPPQQQSQQQQKKKKPKKRPPKKPAKPDE